MIVMSEPFTNEPIAVDDLPRLEDAAFVSVDPRYVWGRLVVLSGWVVAVVSSTVLIVWRSDATFWPTLVGAVIVAALVGVAILDGLEARRLAYQLREHDLSLRSGVIRHRVETIPFSRIQHVSVGRGVVERSLGLATLQVSSAGPDITVPGLSTDDAERIKRTVAERAGADDEPPVAGGRHDWAPPRSPTSPGPTP
jgi:membrane protein YdbS with pleckstrin-like domain